MILVSDTDPEPLKKPEIAQGDVVDAIRGTNLTLACEITVPDGDDIDIHWKQPSSAVSNSTLPQSRQSFTNVVGNQIPAKDNELHVNDDACL